MFSTTQRMNEEGAAFIESLGIDAPADMDRLRHDLSSERNPFIIESITAELVTDGEGNPEHLIRSLGAEYRFSQISYKLNGVPRATRMVASIPPGSRTELAYWAENAPNKRLDIHQGLGTLAVVYLDDEEPDFWTEELDPTGEPPIQLRAPSFYTIEASAQSDSALVVSGFYEPPLTDWQQYEAELYPGDHVVTDPSTGKEVRVPYDFWKRYQPDYAASGNHNDPGLA